MTRRVCKRASPGVIAEGQTFFVLNLACAVLIFTTHTKVEVSNRIISDFSRTGSDSLRAGSSDQYWTELGWQLFIPRIVGIATLFVNFTQEVLRMRCLSMLSDWSDYGHLC